MQADRALLTRCVASLLHRKIATMAALRPLLAGNWKMNGVRASLAEIAAIRDGIDGSARSRLDIAICPPSTLLMAAADACAGSAVMIGGQDCHVAPSGAHTGDISAEMLKDAGATLVIVGHSERRTDHGESDELVRSKAEAATRGGLVPILCVGETRAQRDGGETLRVVGRQIDDAVPPGSTGATLVVAYEPVWAIGTGLVPSNEDVAEVHDFIRRRLGTLLGQEGGAVRLLYGGSVKPGNAAELAAIPNVDGMLVGGASLTARDFLGIADAYR